MSLDVKVVTKRQKLRFWTVSKNKEGAVYVFTISKTKKKK